MHNKKRYVLQLQLYERALRILEPDSPGNFFPALPCEGFNDPHKNHQLLCLFEKKLDKMRLVYNNNIKSGAKCHNKAEENIN